MSLEQAPSVCSGLRPLRPADIAARPYQSECAAGGRYGALETARASACQRRLAGPHRGGRRGFNMVELLLALAISGALLAATMAALDASFTAYQTTTEMASTHTIGRLTMHRVLALIRTGQEFGPFPANPQDSFVESNYIEFITPGERYIALEWMEFPDAANGYPVGEALYVVVDSQPPQLLLEGVVRQDDPDVPGDYIRPFRLEYKLGRNLYRATIDLMLVPDDNLSTELDGDYGQVIRLVASAMPRLVAY